MLLQWAFALPVTILRLPYSFVEPLIWSAMLYWIIGFAPSAGRYCPGLESATQCASALLAHPHGLQVFATLTPEMLRQYSRSCLYLVL